jgi:CheY-like chemotaxis protein
MDGYEVARTLRSSALTAELPLIALTGYSTDADRRRSHEAGFAKHLVKPADPDELRQVLAEAVDR